MPRLEGAAKVTGSAEYIHNLRVPGMLHGKICRSSIAHGRIVGIDPSAALALEGVHAVITIDDVLTLVPNPYYGPAFHDQPILAHGKVRHVGEPVAVVLATDPHVAEEASDLVEIEYEPIEAVFDEVAAARPGAPVIHDVLKPAGMFTDLKYLQGRSGTNVALDARVRRGDVARGFAESDRIFEHTFRTGKVMHATFEPMVSLAEMNGHDDLTIHTASQSPSFVRSEVSRLLGWPENRVRVRTAFLGGGFGAKLYIKLEALVAVCALIVRKPVRIALTMDEQFYTITKHGATVRIKTGVKNDGRMIAREVETFWNGGAYADIGPRVTQKSGFTAAGPYDIEHVALDNFAVYTNDAAGRRAARVRHLAARRGPTSGRPTSSPGRSASIRSSSGGGTSCARGVRTRPARGLPTWKSPGVLDLLSERMEWHRPFDRGTGTIRRGRGLALGLKACISPTTSVAIVQVYGDGSCAVHCGTVDMGQGSDTAMAQVAGEVLGIRDRIRPRRAPRYRVDAVRHGHARIAVHVPHGPRRADGRRGRPRAAAGHRRPRVRRRSDRSRMLGMRRSCRGDGRRLTLRELMLARFAMQAGNLVGVGSYAPSYEKADPETGQSAGHHAVLDARRRGRRDRRRHGDRPHQRHEAGERGGRRPGDQPVHRRASADRARRSCRWGSRSSRR